MHAAHEVYTAQETRAPFGDSKKVFNLRGEKGAAPLLRWTLISRWTKMPGAGRQTCPQSGRDAVGAVVEMDLNLAVDKEPGRELADVRAVHACGPSAEALLRKVVAEKHHI